MTDRSPALKLVAILAVVALQGTLVPAGAGVPASAAIEGSIISSVDQEPLSGARIHLGDPQTGEVFSSSPAADDGVFALGDVPAATYQVGVEHDGGLYVVETPVSLAPGQTQPLMVAINPQQAPSPEEAAKKQGKQSGRGVWNNPVTAALIVLGAAIVLGVIINEATKDDDASPS